MLNEILEFKSYTEKPQYKCTGKRDMSYLGRFNFDMLLDFTGLNRVLTIIARGYMWENDEPDIDRAYNALKAWCSLPTRITDDYKAQTNFSFLHTTFPELVSEDGTGWYIQHIHNICKFVKANQSLMSVTTIDKCRLLEKGFDKEWNKKVIQFQIPIFTPTTQGQWLISFDDVIANALELGKLKNKDFELSDEVKDYILSNLPDKKLQSVTELLVKYHIANKPVDSDKVVLLVVSFDAFFGNSSFSKKQLPKIPDTIIKRDKTSYGVSRYELGEGIYKLISID